MADFWYIMDFMVTMSFLSLSVFRSSAIMVVKSIPPTAVRERFVQNVLKNAMTVAGINAMLTAVGGK